MLIPMRSHANAPRHGCQVCQKAAGTLVGKLADGSMRFQSEHPGDELVLPDQRYRPLNDDGSRGESPYHWMYELAVSALERLVAWVGHVCELPDAPGHVITETGDHTLADYAQRVVAFHSRYKNTELAGAVLRDRYKILLRKVPPLTKTADIVAKWRSRV